MSLRLRLTLLNSLILLVVGGALVGSVYASLAQNLESQLDASLREQARLYGASTDVLFDRATRQPLLKLPNLQRFVGPNAFIQLVDGDGRVRARSETLGEDTLPLPPEALAAAQAGGEWLGEVDVEGERLRQLVAQLRIQGPPGPSGAPATAPTELVIQVARPLGPLRETLRTLQVTVAGVGAAGVLGALAAGWLLARAALRPVDLLATTADAIGAARDFGRRVPLRGGARDEIGRLAAAFNRMLGELQAAHDQLAAALAAQRRFVADASHELRTPLGTLRGNIDLLRHMAGACPPCDAHQADILADLGAETERMSRLVADLLLLAQADAGQHLTLRPLDVADVARNAARAARLLRDDVALEVGGPADGLPVQGHADRLRQVVLILLDNALKLTPPGGRVRLEAAPAQRASSAGVALRVADMGPGIPPDEQDRIFERFYRGHGARSGEGTGLGLAIARWIVDEHHGSLEVASTPGQGAVFTIWLPVAPPTPPDGREPASAPPQPARV